MSDNPNETSIERRLGMTRGQIEAASERFRRAVAERRRIMAEQDRKP